MRETDIANSHGRFVWYELMTTDMEAAKAFYAEVIGWGTQDASMPGMGPPETTRWEYPFADRSWDAETAEFIAAISEDRRPIGDAAEAMACMSVIERIYQGACI